MKESKFEYANSPTPLRQKRMLQKVSQMDVAFVVGLGTTSFGDVERGKRLVSEETAQSISKYLKSNLLDLFEKQGKKYLARKK